MTRQFHYYVKDKSSRVDEVHKYKSDLDSRAIRMVRVVPHPLECILTAFQEGHEASCTSTLHAHFMSPACLLELPCMCGD